MSADTDLIRAYGSAAAGRAGDLDAVAGRLTAVSAPTFGPVGARFQAALTRAAEREAGVVAGLGGSLTAAHT
ncbi:MAG: ESX-1 secretion-associated protein, partial [Dietzia sp.]|nr:ESX-1 secretion-associated protein [Dietzia sp.]